MAAGSDLYQDQYEKTRILLVDPYPLLRQALKTGIGSQQDMEVIAEVCDCEEALLITKRLHPELILISAETSISPDVRQSGMVQTVKCIKKEYPDIKIVVMCPINYEPDIFELQQAGASGYFMKNDFLQGMIHAIRSVIGIPELFYEPLSRFNPRKLLTAEEPSPNNSDVLSLRESMVLKLISSGMSNKDIASKMQISLPSVKMSVSNIFLKLRVSSRTEAISFGLKYGILQISDVVRK